MDQPGVSITNPYKSRKISENIADHYPAVGTADRAVDSEETTMSHTKVLAALSVAMILGAAPAAMAAKAHKDAHTAKGASAQASAAPAATTTESGRLTWCGVDPQCNGWADWLRRIQAGDDKLRTSPPGSMH